MSLAKRALTINADRFQIERGINPLIPPVSDLLTKRLGSAPVLTDPVICPAHHPVVYVHHVVTGLKPSSNVLIGGVIMLLMQRLMREDLAEPPGPRCLRLIPRW
jgi:hypothetical protein